MSSPNSCNPHPLVTVIICTYNSGEFLKPAVLSILNQTYSNIELLIVDDGSTDNSIDDLKLIKDCRVRILRQKNAGKSAAMNRALNEAQGEFYAIQDADDLSYPHRIETQTRHLISKPELAGVFCGYDLIISRKHIAPRFSPKSAIDCKYDIDNYHMPGHDPTAMYRKRIVGDMRYSTDLKIAEGYDYILRAGERAPLEVCGGCLYSYRIQNSGLSKKNPRQRIDYVQEAYRRAVVRRGASTADSDLSSESTNLGRIRRRDLDNNFAAHFIESALDLRRAGERLQAFRVGIYCVRIWPWDPHYWKALAYSLAPLWILRVARMRNRI